MGENREKKRKRKEKRSEHVLRCVSSEILVGGKADRQKIYSTQEVWLNEIIQSK